MLADRLHLLVDHGLVERHDDGGVPSRVEYALTARRRTLRPVLLALWDWGVAHG